MAFVMDPDPVEIRTGGEAMLRREEVSSPGISFSDILDDIFLENSSGVVRS
jgi:hypothetical protein